MTHIFRYDSPGDLARACEAESCVLTGDMHEDSWFGRQSPEETLRFAKTGNTSHITEAESLMSRIDASIETPSRMMVPDLCGAYPMVPEAIAGHPLSMRRMQESLSDIGPMAIYVCMTSEAEVTATHLRDRGIAILALVMALSKVRPIDLYVMDINGLGNLDETPGRDAVAMARVETRPLDLATASYVLTSAAFVRRLLYGMISKRTGCLTFPGGSLADATKPAYYAGLGERLGVSPTNGLLLRAAHVGDRALTDPVGWVQEHVDRFTTSNR